MYKAILPLTIIICFAASCGKKEFLKEPVAIKADNQITILFESRSKAKDTLYFPGGASVHRNSVTSYASTSSPIWQVINIDHNKLLDTISILTKVSINIRHPYNYSYSSIYQFEPGDTAVFRYKDGVPFAKILNRQVPDSLLNFQVYYDQQQPTQLDRVEFFMTNKRFRTASEEAAYYERKDSIQLKKVEVLKALNPAGFHDVKNTILAFEQYKRPALFYKTLQDKLLYDSLLANPIYQSFLTGHSDLLFKPETIKRGNGTFIYNYKQLFDSVKANKNMYGPQNYQFVQYSNLVEIAEKFSTQDFQKYYQLFKQEVTDSIYLNDINNNYITDFAAINGNSNITYLVNNRSQKLTLSNIIEQNKGKVMYIDFWASWCKPCLEAMPASKKLKAEFKGQDVAFIYISIDKNRAKWARAAQEQGLSLYNGSYLAMNYPDANYYKQLQLGSIPRYLLIDKQGQIAFTNAPDPGSEQLRQAIDKLLRQ